jgi:hypothetical protein
MPTEDDSNDIRDYLDEMSQMPSQGDRDAPVEATCSEPDQAVEAQAWREAAAARAQCL